MIPRLFYLLPVTLGLLGVACADQNGGGPSAPQDEGLGAAVTSLSCDFSGFNSLVAQYFTKSSTQQDAKNFVGAMQTAGKWSTGAVDNGFNVMALIAGAVKSGEVGSSTTGSTLTNELIKCMFDVTTGDFLTGTPPKSIIPIDFTASLDPVRPGAYAVHGGSGDLTSDAVKSRLSAGADPLTTDPISAIGTQGATWANLLNERALIYGRPVVDGQTTSLTAYQWEAIRPSASFSAPGALVAICAATGSADMVHESNFGVLAFGSAAELCPNPLEVGITGWGPAALAQRLGRLLAPQPLHAATLLLKSIGGSAGGLKSIFSNTPVPSVTLKFLAGPPSVFKQNQDVTVKIQATLPGTTTGVNGVCVFLTGTNNNGTPTELLPKGECNSTAPSAVTGRVGSITGVAEVTFHVTKTGNLMLSGNGTVVERTGTVASTLPVKTNVKP
jgi:hypothetical protein